VLHSEVGALILQQDVGDELIHNNNRRNKKNPRQSTKVAHGEWVGFKETRDVEYVGMCERESRQIAGKKLGSAQVMGGRKGLNRCLKTKSDYLNLAHHVDVSGSIRHVFPHRSMCLDVWKSSKAFYS
jgi:hypothetical protein